MIKKQKRLAPNVIPNAAVIRCIGFAINKINKNSKINLQNIAMPHIFIVVSIDLFFINLNTNKLIKKRIMLINKAARIEVSICFSLYYTFLLCGKNYRNQQ